MAVERPVFTPPEWYTGEKAEEIQTRMMEALPADIDNIEGGFPYDFTMPTALEEDELLNFYLIETLKIMFPAWAYGDYLNYHAAAVGLSRKAANPAAGTVVITGLPGTQIPAGTILDVPAVGDVPAVEFSVDTAAYIGAAPAGSDYGTVSVAVTAVEAGTGGNVAADTVVIMSVPITGVVSLTNPEPITGGTAEETDDDLYARIAQAENSGGESYVGCDADYIRWAGEVPGVGTVLVDTQYEEDHPNWVKLIILDSNGQPANDQILTAVYQHIMNPDARSRLRLAPIGAILVVEAPTGAEITITVTGLQISDGSTSDEIVRRFKTQLEQYYIEAKAEGVLKWNRIHAIFTETEGVADFEALTVNGGIENIELAAAAYPVTNEVSIE